MWHVSDNKRYPVYERRHLVYRDENLDFLAVVGFKLKALGAVVFQITFARLWTVDIGQDSVPASSALEND